MHQIDEVAAALKKLKRQSPGLLQLAAEMIQAPGDIGTQWMLDLCNAIVKEGCIPEDWKSSVVLPICITSLQRERGSNGVWILEKN